MNPHSDPLFFETQAEFERWLEKHHASNLQVLVGFRKRRSGLPSMTWPEAVDVALCFGWIDGVRRSAGETSYTIRFTPRRPSSIWSAVNIRRATELLAQGKLRPSGRAAFETRDQERTNRYSFERASVELPPELDLIFRKNPGAWEFFQSQPPSYRKPALWWVVSAKRQETRERRLKVLIDASVGGRRIDMLAPNKRSA